MTMTLTTQVLIGSFVIALILGAVVYKTHFCTLGAISDWINIGDSGRFRSWMLAIAVALAGVLILENGFGVSFDQTRPPYRTAEFAWLRYLLGGFMFGVGMTLASGCTSKNLVRFGGGNFKSLVVLAMVAVFSYLMTKTDFYAYLFHSWMSPLAIDLTGLDRSAQDLGTLIAGDEQARTVRLWLGGLLTIALLLWCFASAEFRRHSDNIVGGIVVGLCIVGGWYLTGGSLGQEWIEEVEWLDVPPLGVGVQSYTFVNPLGEAMVYLANPADTLLVTFGVAAVAGMLLGSFGYAIATGRWRWEWFHSWVDLIRHIIGGALMGIGGVLAMGCTFGQGITGVSTLALGSLLALGAIMLGSATTMKIEYYRMLYEDASLWDALLSGWADLRLLPRSARRLEAL